MPQLAPPSRLGEFQLRLDHPAKIRGPSQFISRCVAFVRPVIERRPIVQLDSAHSAQSEQQIPVIGRPKRFVQASNGSKSFGAHQCLTR